MIICHPLKLIFIKTKKVGGTSFEIALSSLCDSTSIITQISPQDEALRQKIGCPGAQNYVAPVWTGLPGGADWRSPGNFYNHIPAPEAQAMIPQEIWSSYRKITIYRDPYDAAISCYFWEGALRKDMNFHSFLEKYPTILKENTRIAPLEGPAKLDSYMRYESLAEEVAALEVPGLLELFQALGAKGTKRPKQGTSVEDIYRQFPGAADIVARECAEEINRFGYTSPLQSAA